ncbi:hypothetical protein M0M57_13970 [Flavobacterium azooxidireducens]|uniref:DUF4942 domain-containing protein n=1 Tax=Flavobacterium azooxidireducens TaxID=1871076 RepID=A0ABY4KD53_9FLAO|nr:hypothetical protein [Flavobacterium azooxidireducens]UPQ78721.1 hypothetical protein M0M57_13970 [Flavobacterium azooxidireducens]
MINIEHHENFKKLLNSSKDYETIGLGNPNAKILFVGKEAGIEIEYCDNLQDIFERLKNFHGSTFQWKSNQFDYSNNPKMLKELSDTWQNYQQLFSNIYENEKNSLNATFLKKVFTTEMSNLPSKTTGGAKKNPFFKEELNNRKNSFFNSDFIKAFPVVVLACNDYIKNDEKNREINNIFGVKYSGEFKEYSKGNWFFIHYNDEKTKLVIHTRQLSANVNNDLLSDIGKVIKRHLKKLNLFE